MPFPLDPAPSRDWSENLVHVVPGLTGPYSGAPLPGLCCRDGREQQVGKLTYLCAIDKAITTQIWKDPDPHNPSQWFRENWDFMEKIADHFISRESADYPPGYTVSTYTLHSK